MASAQKDALIGKIQERYGIVRDEAERPVDEWIAMPPTHGDVKQAQKEMSPKH